MISVSFSQGSHYQPVCHLSPVFITSVVSVVVVAFDAKQILQSKGQRSALNHPRILSQKDTFAQILIKRADLFIKLPSSCDAIHQKFEKEESRQSEKHIHVARVKHMQAERETQEDAEKMTTKGSR